MLNLAMHLSFVTDLCPKGNQKKRSSPHSVETDKLAIPSIQFPKRASAVLIWEAFSGAQYDGKTIAQLNTKAGKAKNKEKQTEANKTANKLRLIALLDLFHFQAGHRIAFLKGIY